MVWNLFKVNNRTTRTTSNDLFVFSVCIVNFEHISELFSSVFIDDFDQVDASWVSLFIVCNPIVEYKLIA